jgi:nitrite reductase (NO-forming)
MNMSVPVEAAAHALRRVRPSVYRLGQAERTTITLTVNASAAGRRNSATRVVAALTDSGIDLLSDDPVSELADGATLALAHRDRDHKGISPRRRRHAIAASLIAGYLVAAVGAVAAHRVLAVPEWLALHLLVLGAAGNAVLVYSQHFAEALLHTRSGPQWPANARIAVFNAGAIAVLTGVSVRLAWLSAAGATLVVIAVIAHTAALIATARAARLSGRLRVVIRYYIAAGSCLAVGGTLGGLLAAGTIRTPRWQQAVRLAHAHLNLLGWLGLAVVGTLFMLWPAVLRTRMADTAPHTARRVFTITVTGLAVAVTGALLTGLTASAHWLAAAGMAGYAAGVAYAVVPAARELRAAPPRSAAPVALLAGHGWLFAALAVDIAGLARGGTTADDLLGRVLVPALGIGVVAQTLTGALTFLVPVTVGGGPLGNRRLTEVLEYAWLPRALLGNVGTLLLVLPVSSGPRVLAWALVVVGFGSFPALVVAALVATRRQREPAHPRGLAIGCVTAVLAVLALAGAGWPGHDAGATAKSGVPLVVGLDEFAITPDVITVAPGTDLVLTVRNTGRTSHDLKLDGQHGTRMLAPGQQQTVDLGVVTHDELAWCAVPGHRAAGMTLAIRTTTSTATNEPPDRAMAGMTMPMTTNTGPPPTWHLYDPTLRPDPATRSRRHRTRRDPAGRPDNRRGRTGCAATGVDVQRHSARPRAARPCR